MDIDIAANKKCYALAWSYGEICVGCGCCSANIEMRTKARIKYHEDLLRDCRSFNLAEDIRYHEERLNELRRELDRSVADNI